MQRFTAYLGVVLITACTAGIALRAGASPIEYWTVGAALVAAAALAEHQAFSRSRQGEED